MVDGSAIREHMEVLGSDGKHVGKIDHVLGSDIKLTKALGMGSHHLLPISYVDHVEGDKVVLAVTEDEAKRRWREAH